MVVTLLGIVIDGMLWHEPNACWGITVILLGITIAPRLVQNLNENSPILIRLAGSVTWTSEEQS
jgi:hypothetical protein